MANSPKSTNGLDELSNGTIEQDEEYDSSGSSGSGSGNSGSGNSGSGSGSGNGTSGSDGAAGITGTRKKRRTRAEIEAEETVGMVTPATKPLRKTSQKTLSEVELAMATSGLFNLIASVRGDYWSKSPDECMVFARPASQWMESVTPAVAKQLQAVFLPLSTLMGLGCMLVGPLSAEKEILDVKALAKSGSHGNVPTGQSSNRGAGNPQKTANAGSDQNIREQKRHPDELAGSGSDTDTF